MYLNFNEILDLELELTTYCNANCPLCYRNYKTFNTHYPKNIQRQLSDIIKQLDNYSNLKYIRLVGSISEPTLYKDFFSLIKYLKQRNIIIEICTNGDTNNIKWWKKLSTLLTPLDSVYFTICGSTQKIHEIYRSNTSLKNILDNVSSFRSSNNNDYAQCIKFQYNSHDIDSDFFIKFINSYFSNIYITETFLSKNDDNYIFKDNLDLLKPILSKQEKYFTIEKLANKKLGKKAFCKSFYEKSQQVDVNGNVYPCYLFLEASNGKLWDQDYSSILNLEYDVCKFCEKNIFDLCEQQSLQYII
jgi:MoaA/NifB/PqqE/SkfB family radical SAM enzyme